MATKISELPTTQKVGSILDETLNVGGAATTATTPTVTIPRTTATTNTVEPLLALNRQSSGTPANGIGGSLVFDVKTAAGNTERGATIEAVTTDVTETSEDFDLVFKTMAAGGAAAERARIKSTGTMLLGYGNSTDLALALVDSRGFYAANGGIVFKNSVGNLWMAPSSAGTGVQITSDGQFSFVNSTASAAGAPSSGFAYQASGVIRVTDGNTGIGSILSKALVEANTAGSGAPNVLVGIESGTILTNEDATAQNYHTLPTAVAGLVFEFVVQDADGIRVVAATGDTIQDVGTVSATAGYIQSTTIGSVIRLAAINATQWVVMSKQGTWTVDS